MIYLFALMWGVGCGILIQAHNYLDYLFRLAFPWYKRWIRFGLSFVSFVFVVLLYLSLMPAEHRQMGWPLVAYTIGCWGWLIITRPK